MTFAIEKEEKRKAKAEADKANKVEEESKHEDVVLLPRDMRR